MEEFKHPLWNKIVFWIPILLMVGVCIQSILPLNNFFKVIVTNLTLCWIVVGIVTIIFLILDFYAYNLFSKSIVNKEGLTYIPGGIFWKRVLKRQRFFSWKDYGFYLHYYDIYEGEDINYTMLVIKDREGKIYLKLDRSHIANFEKLAERFKEYCPAVELVEHTFIR